MIDVDKLIDNNTSELRVDLLEALQCIDFGRMFPDDEYTKKRAINLLSKYLK